MTDKLRKLAPYGVLFFVVLLLEVIFFRGIFFNTDKIPGDMADGRLISLILEHWFKVFTGENTIRDLTMFYPVRNTLGYSDTMFLVSLPYSLLRAVGFSWLSAYQITIIIIHTFGGLCLAYFLKKKLNLPVWACILGLIVGQYSNAYFAKLQHLQFITTSFLPLLVILVYCFFENLDPSMWKKRLIYGISAIILYASILTTSVYIGYFTALFLLIFIVAVSIYKYKAGEFKIKQLLSELWKNKIEGLIYAAVTILALIPFIWIYLPVFIGKGSSGYPWEIVADYLPRWYDLFNVSPNNRMWQFPDTGNYELIVGFPLVTAIILILSCTDFIRKKSRDSDTVMAIGFSFAIALGLLFIIQIDLSGLNIGGILSRITKLFGLPEAAIRHTSLWWLVYFLVPGASALRAAGRFTFFMMLPAGILSSYFISLKIKAADNTDRKKYFKYVLVITILLAVIFIEHQNTLTMTNWTKSGANQYLQRVSPPPGDLESFILINNEINYPAYPDIGLQVDAWSIATKFGVNTINGYSGQFPAGWVHLFPSLTDSGNFANLQEWINIHNLNNVYLYDYLNDMWIPATEQTLIDMEKQFFLDAIREYTPGEHVETSTHRSAYQFNGWSFPEGEYTWTDGDETLIAMQIPDVNPESTDNLLLQLNIRMVFNESPADIFINETYLDTVIFEEGSNIINIPNELIIEDILVIKLAFLSPVSPQMLGLSEDNRLLGIAVESFNITLR